MLIIFIRSLNMYQRVIFIIITTVLAFSTYSCSNEDMPSLQLSIDNEEIVYDNGTHAAFTNLINYNGKLLLAFRESRIHKCETIEDYGKIVILEKQNDGSFSNKTELIDKDKDLRDPFLIEVNGKLRVYVGYNQFYDGVYQHRGTCYSEYDGKKWSDFYDIEHDVPHIIWLWKIRKYHNLYYGVGYLEGEKPVLLSSQDGVRWKTLSIFNLDGVFSEADMLFDNDKLFVCLRKDNPVGSSSFWGESMSPFVDFKWKEMNVSVASPDFFQIRNNILLAGREYDFGREEAQDSINVSLFSMSKEGIAKRQIVFNTGRLGDKGYPSFAYYEGKVFMSYYSEGSQSTHIIVAEIK